MNLKTKRKNQKLFVIALLFFMLTTIFLNFTYKPKDEVKNSESADQTLMGLPKRSAGEITVFTPENKFYSDPMSGYYPATYGFENDENGQLPQEWADESLRAGCYIEVKESQTGHNKVAHLNDTVSHSSEGRVQLNQYFDNGQSEGTIELWFQTSDVTPITCIKIREPDHTTMIDLGFHYDDLYYISSGKQYSISVSDNTWYHFRISWNSNEKWNYTVRDTAGQVLDSKQNLDFINSGTPGNIHFLTGGSYTYDTYLDAVGYSWDPRYTLGDNLNEGLLLGYDNTTTFDWQGYSLDAKTNRTILGNVTIPMPSNGSHNIQVFGNSSTGQIYASQPKHFGVGEGIIIKSPQDKTYNTASDHFMGTYFTPNFDFPESYWYNDSEPETNVYSQSFAKGHKDVLVIEDNNTSAFTDPGYRDGITRGHGSIEFYYMISGTLTGNIPVFRASRDSYPWRLIGLCIQDGEWWYDGSSSLSKVPNVINPQLDTWYQIKIDWCRDGTNWEGLADLDWQVTIDGISSGSLPYNHLNNYDPTYFHFPSSIDNTVPYKEYYDALSFSWDENYNSDQCLDPAIPLVFENSTNLDWIGYSLDDMANVTISGNSTIPLPEDGPHSIQVFGNNTSGNIFESQVRHFNVDTDSLDSININSPENKTYTESMSGYHPATYGFENDENGQLPQEWIDESLRAGCYIEAKESQAGHNKVAHLDDTVSHSTEGRVQLNQYFDNIHSEGTIELWFQTSDVTPITCIKIREPDHTTMIDLGFHYDDLYYIDSSKHYSISVSDNTWYHFKISWNSNEKWNYTVRNSVGQVLDSKQNLDFINSGTPGNLHFLTGGDYIYDTYLDAVGYSWDPRYTLGDNLNEGLLLGYDNTTTLDWQGYSLDGQANVTISGNKTIPTPEDGIHTIQVFGNDTSGNMIESELRHFTINCDDLTAPTINTNDSQIYLKQGEACWIGWDISDPADGNYIIYENGTAISSDSFISSAEMSTFIYSETVLSMNYTLIGEDSYGNKGQATVLVSIYSSAYDYLTSSGANIVSREGLYLEIETNGPAFLQISHSSESEDFSDIQGGIWANLTALQFYSFELLNTDYEEDSSLLENATIRFYYPQISDSVKDPSDLYVLHGVYDGQYIKIWDRVDLSLHEEMDYVEITINRFSYYCLAELEVKEGPGNDDDTDDGPDLLIFITDNLIIIIILASVGVAVPTLYTVRSKQQKKKTSAETLKSKEKLSKDTIKHDFKRKAETKRRQLERTWEPEDITDKTYPSKSGKAAPSPAKPLKARQRPIAPKKKVKKSKLSAYDPLTEHEREKIKKERAQTEKEMEIREDVDICQVHKGPIEGVNYICPKCKTKYCLKCAQVLKQRNEGCWVCDTPIKLGLTDLKGNAEEIFINDEAELDLEKYVLGELNHSDISSSRFKDIKITALSKEFLKVVDHLEWEGDEKEIFLNEMSALTPEERKEILDDIIVYRENHSTKD